MPASASPARPRVSCPLLVILCLAITSQAASQEAGAAAATERATETATGGATEAPTPASPHAEAIAAFEGGDAGRARALLEPAARTGDAVAMTWLARVAIEQDQPEEAIDLLERAIAKSPDDADRHYWLGVALNQRREQVSRLFQVKWAKRMRAAWEEALRRDPDHAGAHSALVEFHLEAPGIVGGDEAKAWDHARELARVDPVGGNVLLSNLHRGAGEHGLAADALLRAVAAGAGPQLEVYLVVTLTDAGRHDEAFRRLDAALAERPDDLALVYQLGRLAAVTGERLDDGERALRRFLAADDRAGELPPEGGAHWRLALIAEHRGDREAARREVETALRLEPELEGAKDLRKRLGG